MPFEDVNILVQVGTTDPEVRWRQDGSPGAVVTFSLSDDRDVRTYNWSLIGRPEGTGAAGGGPEPISLGTGRTCAITLDIQGTYIVACVINGGSTTQTAKTAGVAILCAITDPAGRPLRYLGGYETDEDTADPLVAQGWMKMLDRWLHALEQFILGGGVDTFKVAVDAADVTAQTYGFLPEKLVSPKSTIDITPRVGVAQPRTGLDVARNSAAPRGSVFGGNPGNGPQAAMWDHQHPPDVAPAEGSWIYTGSIQATNLLDPVKAFVSPAEGGSGMSGATPLWEVLPNGDLRHLAVGQLYGRDPTGSSTIALAQGQRVWCVLSGSLMGTTTRAGGICTVQVLGNGSTKAVLRPTADSLGNAATFKVEGAGAQYEGWYWEIDTSDPLDYWLIYRPDYVNETTYNLLTGEQLQLAGTVTRETEVTIPGGSSGGVMFTTPLYIMLQALGLTAVPKGVVNWEILAYVVTDNPSAHTFVRAFLSTDDGVLKRFGYGDSQAIHNTAPTVLKFQGAISADQACDPADRLSAVFYGYSDSPTDVTVRLVFNSAAHSTRVQVPLKLGGGGSGDHKYSIDQEDENNGGAAYGDQKLVAGSGITIAKVAGPHGKALQLNNDHLVRARTADATAVGGLLEKTTNSATVTREVTTEAGVEKVSHSVVCGSATPLGPTPGGAVGTAPNPSHEDHQHDLQQVQAEAVKGVLFAAHLSDPKLHVSVATSFWLATGGGHEVIAFKYDWDPVSPGVWKCKFPGITSPMGYCRGVTPTAGMRVWVGYLGEDGYPGAAMNADDKPRTGIYEFIDPGRRWIEPNGPYEDTYAVVRRVDDADAASDFAPGMVVLISGGDSWVGNCASLTTTGTIVLENTPLEWEKLTSYTPVESDALLTAAQLSAADEIPSMPVLAATASTPSPWLTFPTLPGTPGQDEYPAGRTEWQALAYLDAAGDSGSSTWLECELWRDLGGASALRIRSEVTSPITNPTAEAIKTFVDSLTATELAGHDLAARFRAVTTSVTETARIAVAWSDAAHTTRVTTPMTFAIGGTDDHQALTKASRGFEAGDPDAMAKTHPMASIQPGLITWDTGPEVATVDGLLTLPPKTNAVRISGTETLLGIATAGLTPGTVIYVEMSAGRPVANGGSPPVGYAAPSFHTAMGFLASPVAFLAPANAPMVLELSGSSNWRVLSAPWVEPQRALWPSVCTATINTTTAPGLLELPAGCPGVVYVTGTALRAITVDDADGNAQAGPLGGLKLYFATPCTLYHDDPLSGWDAGLAARAAKLDLLPPAGATGNDRNSSVRAKNVVRFALDTFGASRLWTLEVGQ